MPAHPDDHAQLEETSAPPTAQQRTGSWTFLTNYGHTLVALARDGDLRIRDLALVLGVTERTVQTIVNELVAGGYITRTRVGARSRYEVVFDRPFRHPVERDHSVGELLRVLQRRPQSAEQLSPGGGDQSS